MDGNSMFQCMLCGCMWGLSEPTFKDRYVPVELISRLAYSPGVDHGHTDPAIILVRYRVS